MAQAALQFSFKQTRIDAEKNVIYGVKVIELGEVKSDHGPSEVKHKHIASFMAHAGNRAIPVHWTHDYLDEDKDRLHAKVGALKNFRVDGDGDLAADFHVAPTEYRDAIFWGAETDPDNMMFSVVFSYDPKDPEGLPLDFQAADLVERGAATTALFSETNTMTPDEIKSLVADSVKAAIAEYQTQNKETQDVSAAALSAATGEIAALKAELANVSANAETKAKEIAAAELTAAEARFTAALGKGASFKPEGNKEIAAMSRADFAKLSPAEQRDYILTKRGKVQD